MFATNHKKALSHHRFVNDMYAQETEAGRMLQFSVQQSSPFFPCMVYPTGATTKKKRCGAINDSVMRPTTDYSWPPRQHWLRWLVRSANESVDLDSDFPWLHYVTTMDFIEQILFLKSLGVDVV